MGAWWEREVFSDPRDPLPFRLDDYRMRRAELRTDKLATSVLASCSIPYWLDPVHDIPGAPRGAYWDGGIVDHHLHLNHASMPHGSAGPADEKAHGAGLVLYPHFQRSVIPGWLDKFLTHRHRASARLSNVILLSPNREWVKTLPNGKLPDRADFKHCGDDVQGRVAAWSNAVANSSPPGLPAQQASMPSLWPDRRTQTTGIAALVRWVKRPRCLIVHVVHHDAKFDVCLRNFFLCIASSKPPRA